MEPRWYLLNFIAPAMRRKEMLTRRIQLFNSTNGTDLKVFAPEIVEAERRKGEIHFVSRPFIYHYIFVHGSLDQLKRLCGAGEGLSFVINRNPSTSEGRYQTISDSAISAFRIIARAYSNRLPYYHPTDIQLLEGDEVEVVSGQFTGLKGTFIARKGTQNGHIVVQANQQLGSIAYDIKADTIRILRFAKDSRRAYDQIDAFVPRLLEALEAYRADRPLTPAQSAPLHIFTRRFSATEIPGAKLDAKLQALLATAHRILGNESAAEEARARYEKRLPHVTNPRTRELLSHLMTTPV